MPNKLAEITALIFMSYSRSSPRSDAHEHRQRCIHYPRAGRLHRRRYGHLTEAAVHYPRRSIVPPKMASHRCRGRRLSPTPSQEQGVNYLVGVDMEALLTSRRTQGWGDDQRGRRIGLRARGSSQWGRQRQQPSPPQGHCGEEAREGST